VPFGILESNRSLYSVAESQSCCGRTRRDSAYQRDRDDGLGQYLRARVLLES
jgi:hypothetical protein